MKHGDLGNCSWLVSKYHPVHVCVCTCTSNKIAPFIMVPRGYCWGVFRVNGYGLLLSTCLCPCAAFSPSSPSLCVCPTLPLSVLLALLFQTMTPAFECSIRLCVGAMFGDNSVMIHSMRLLTLQCLCVGLFALQDDQTSRSVQMLWI